MQIQKQASLLISILMTGMLLQAQTPEVILENWSARSPIEKVHLHFDKDNYLAGETIWFKAYLYSEYFPDTISTTLYVELLNGSSNILDRKILPVFAGNTQGQIDLPDTLATGSYVIRAYSPTMLNADPEFLFKQSIFVFGKKNNQAIKSSQEVIKVDFFPEGGNFITNLPNTVVIKISDERGLPVNRNGSIKNEKNETVTEFTNYHDGMSMFDFKPSPGGKYYAVLSGDSSGKKYYLPESVEKGVVLRLIPHPEGSYFDIGQKADDPAFQVAYMIGQMQHHVVFRVNFPVYKNEIHGVINTLHLTSGILQVTVFNKDGLPLGERLSFVNNKEYILPSELTIDTLNFSSKAKNRFTISLKDTVQGSISISVIDPDYTLTRVRENNIFSDILLTSDLKGYIHNPAYYFSKDDDSVKTSMDLVMMSNGWRRFKWTDLTKKTIPLSNYKDPAYITLAGQINLRDTRRPFADKSAILFISGADSSRSMQMIATDKGGYFKLDSLLFFGTARVFFSDVRGKKSDFIEVKPSADSLGRRFILPPLERKLFAFEIPEITRTKMTNDYDAIMRAEGVMLKDVVVKTRKKSPVQELEDKYTSGAFSGMSSKTIDLTNTIEPIVQDNIFDYLAFRVPGIGVEKDGFDYKIYYRQSVGTGSTAGNPPMTLYLNEVETDASFISSIPADQIAMVKVFSTFIGASGNGAGGVLAIYTKKGSDLNDLMSSTGDQVKYNGFSVIKEFYSPDYKADMSARSKPDHRITLEWRPGIFLSNINPKIPVTFFNNDRSKQFRIVVEGMTRNGKMILLEKIITAGDKKPF